MTATEKTTAACNIIRALGIHPASEEGHTTRRAITKYLTNEAGLRSQRGTSQNPARRNRHWPRVASRSQGPPHRGRATLTP